MDIDSFQFDTQAFLALSEQDLEEMLSSDCSFDDKSLQEKDYEDEETLQTINYDDLSEWIDCDHLLNMEFDNELNSCDFSENIFSDAPAAKALLSFHSGVGFDNQRVLEFASKMSRLSISMQRSELTCEAIRQHCGLLLEQNKQYSGLPAPCCSPVYRGNMNQLANKDYSRAQCIENISRMNRVA